MDGYLEALQSGFLDELNKIASATSLAKKKGLGRVAELLTGSRKGKLKDRAGHLARRGTNAISTGLYAAQGGNIAKALRGIRAGQSHARVAKENAQEFVKEHGKSNAARAVGAGVALTGAIAGGAAALSRSDKNKKKTAGRLGDILQPIQQFATGAKAGAKGAVHAVKGAVKPGAPAVVRGIVAGGAAVPAAAGAALGAGGMYAATRGKKEKTDDKEKMAYAERMLPGTERYYSDRMRSILMGLAPRVYTPEGA